MSLIIGTGSSYPKEMAWEEEKDAAGRLREYFEKEVDGQEKKVGDHCGDEVEEVREKEVSLCAYEEEEKDGEEDAGKVLDLGPLVSLIDQMEKDKDDESLRRWKEQLLGTADFNSVGDKLEPDVKILSLSILSLGRPDIILPIPVALNPKGSWFTLKEGSSYRLKFSFSVSNNIVSGLKYTNTVWKTSIKVDRSKEMLGTFSPQLEPYTYVTPEETTPSGIFARGSYSARTKFTDDDGKCYLEINYTFDIRKNWPSASPV